MDTFQRISIKRFNARITYPNIYEVVSKILRHFTCSINQAQQTKHLNLLVTLLCIRMLIICYRNKYEDTYAPYLEYYNLIKL